MGYWHRDGNVDQWKRTANPGVNAYIYGELIFMSIKNIKWGGKDSLFLRMVWNSVV